MALYGHADDAGLEDHLAIDHALGKTDETAGAILDEFSHDVQSRRWSDNAAKLDVVDATKTDETVVVVDTLDGKAGQLGGGLDHEDAGHEGTAGYVAADPEFALGDVFVTENSDIIAVFINDAVQLAHFVAMRVYLFDRFGVEDALVEIYGVEVDDKLRGHRYSLGWQDTPVATHNWRSNLKGGDHLRRAPRGPKDLT